MKRKILPLLLSLCLLLSLAPTALADGDSPQRGDSVYLGEWDGEPLEWTILDPSAMNTGDPGTYLISRYVLENGKVMYDGGVARWPGSKAQAWCGEFLQTAFSALEQAALPAVSKTEEAFQGYDLSWGEVSLEQEKVFFLSTQEIADYIGAKDGDPGISATTADGTEASWWLRTPHGFHTDYSGLVMGNNQVHDFLVYGSWGVRPATNLSAETCLFLSPADQELSIGGLAPIPAADNGCWKATLIDETLNFRLTEVKRDGDGATVSYEGAAAGGYVSALVRNGEGKLLSYARLAAAAGESGELRLGLELLAIPEGAALYLFTEQENGARRSNAASVPQLLSLPEEPAEPAPAESAETETEPDVQQPDEVPAPADTQTAETGSEPIGSHGFGALFLRYGLYAAAAIALLALLLGLRQSARKRRR